MTVNGERPPGSADKSIGEIVSDVSEKASLLVREEIELAKAEVTDKVSKLGKGAAVGAAAGVFAIFGVTMLFHTLAWFLDDLFNWNGVWPGFLIVTILLFILAAVAGLVAARLFKSGSPPTPDLAIEEAKRTRAELEAQKIERDQLERSLERGREVGP
ncbi:MAG TPA: phage holin family protein [Thermoleophilaceae bacterium]|jgi:uncharacterized membrane protein YqjE